MAAQSLQNLAALQQLFAPVGQQIAGINAPQLAIAQQEMRRRQALENLAREQAFVRERDQVATQRAMQLQKAASADRLELQNLQNVRDQFRQDSITRREEARQKDYDERQSKREAEALRAKIRAGYSEYKQKGGTKKLTELGDIAADDIATLGELAAALADELGAVQMEAEAQEVKALANLRQQAARAVDAATTVNKDDLQIAEQMALSNLTSLDEGDKKKLARDAAKIGLPNALANLKPEVQREYNAARLMAVRSIQQEKQTGKDSLAALNNLRTIDTQLIQLTSKNPRLGRLFTETMGQSVNESAPAQRADPAAVFGGQKTGSVSTPQSSPSAQQTAPVLPNLGQQPFSSDPMSNGAFSFGQKVGGALKSAGQWLGSASDLSGLNNLGPSIQAQAQQQAEDQILSTSPYSPEAAEIRRRRGLTPVLNF